MSLELIPIRSGRIRIFMPLASEPDPDPRKWCGSEPIRIYNTDFMIVCRFRLSKLYKQKFCPATMFYR